MFPIPPKKENQSVYPAAHSLLSFCFPSLLGPSHQHAGMLQNFPEFKKPCHREVEITTTKCYTPNTYWNGYNGKDILASVDKDIEQLKL